MNILIAEPLAPAGIEMFKSQDGWNVIVSNPKEYAQHLAEAAVRRCLGLRCATARGCRALLGELLADIGQHDRRQNRQQFLDQITATGARSGQRRGDCVAVVATKDARDELVALRCIDLVDVDSAVEKSAGALLGDVGLELARVDRIGVDVFRQPTDQRRHQGADRGVHFAFIGADLVRNVLYGDLCEEIIKTSHYLSTFASLLGC